jgi:hypothetical protein
MILYYAVSAGYCDRSWRLLCSDCGKKGVTVGPRPADLIYMPAAQWLYRDSFDLRSLGNGQLGKLAEWTLTKTRKVISMYEFHPRYRSNPLCRSG